VRLAHQRARDTTSTITPSARRGEPPRAGWWRDCRGSGRAERLGQCPDGVLASYDPRMRTASEFVPGATSGNSTEIDIAAPPGVVWQAMEELRFDDLRATRVLMSMRSLPARVLGRGSLRSGRLDAAQPVLDAMAASRFVVLCREAEAMLTLGFVGQFWKLGGGDDADVSSAAAFVAFDQPGFVKSAIDFELERRPLGTRLTTRTRNRATDEATARRFRRYWLLIGPGSKAIRLDMLRAVRRRAESVQRAAE
jgi:hypothetical protein